MNAQSLNTFIRKPRSVEERMKAGKALRNTHPISTQGDYEPSPKRIDPVAILEKQGKTRLPDLVPIRYARMLTSPFAFLRGAAAIMAADLAYKDKSTGIKVQACGDMHVANFGLFASAERQLIFGINDFDETNPGPWEWDMKRLVTSIVASIRFLGGDDELARECVTAAVKSYRKHMKKYAPMGHLELWYSVVTEDDILEAYPESTRKAIKRVALKARERTHMQVLDKLTDIVDEKYRLKINAPFIVRATHTQKGTPIRIALAKVLESYLKSLADDRRQLLEHYRIVDVVRKIVGVGSVGTRCWVIFLMGNSGEDPLFLQVKEAQPSVLEPFTGKTKYKNNGQRVVAGQRLIQGAPDIFLGWGENEGFDFYVRQLRDMKGGVEFDPDTVNLDNAVDYCKLCAWSMALAHAKSGDAAMISGYIGKGDKLADAMVRFAFSYAAQNEQDYQVLADAAKRNLIKVAKQGA